MSRDDWVILVAVLLWLIGAVGGLVFGVILGYRDLRYVLGVLGLA